MGEAIEDREEQAINAVISVLEASGLAVIESGTLLLYLGASHGVQVGCPAEGLRRFVSWAYDLFQEHAGPEELDARERPVVGDGHGIAAHGPVVAPRICSIFDECGIGARHRCRMMLYLGTHFAWHCFRPKGFLFKVVDFGCETGRSAQAMREDDLLGGWHAWLGK